MKESSGPDERTPFSYTKFYNKTTNHLHTSALYQVGCDVSQ